MKTSKIIYRIALLITLLVITEQGFAQTLGEITVTGDVSNSSGGLYIARDKVTMKNGFKFTRTGNEVFRAKLNESLLFNVDHQPDIDITSRSLDNSLPVGTISGSFSVSLSGAATYSIPILVPPGTADVVPNIGVTYNSMAGDGVMGMGWNISGLSAISRTPKTIYHDGIKGNVNLNSDDRLTLDGNRLICTSGTYGSDASEYHTEIETFSKVITHGDINGSTCWFEVETKDGRTIEYGNGNSSRVILDGSSKTLTWMINKVIDKSGNYVKYSYRDLENSEFVIDKIEYTGNTAGLSPYNSVNFYYETKPVDKTNTMYVAGYPIKQTALLNKIKTICEGNPVKEYKFNYADHLYSQLIEITEFGFDGSHYNSTVFNYNTNTQTPADIATTGSEPGTSRCWILDYNGDGKPELFQMVFQIITGAGGQNINDWLYWNLYSYDGNNTFTPIFSNQSFPPDFDPYDNFYPLSNGFIGNMQTVNSDFDGDNLDEIMFTTITGGVYTMHPYKSDGLTFIEQETFTEDPPTENQLTIRYLDVDGDGRLDIFLTHVNSSSVSEYRLRMNGESTPSITNTLTQKYNFDDSYPIDIDGDGITELANVHNTTDWKYYIMKFTGSSYTFIEHPTSFPPYFDSVNKILTGDFNGDGKTDIFRADGVLPANFNWKIEYSKGDNTFDESVYTNFQSPFPYIDATHKEALHFVADINSDGKSDVVEIFNKLNPDINDLSHPILSTINVFISTGKSFIALTPYKLNWGIDETKNEIDFGDFDADGVPEMFINTEIWGVNQVHIIDFDLSPSVFLLKTIKDGNNFETDINYKNITDASVYTKGTGAAYPNSDFQKPFYVVSSVPINNGFDLSHETTYHYKGAKLHKQGKGFLGFSEVYTKNTNTDIETNYFFETDLTYYMMRLWRSESPNISKTSNTNEIYHFGNKRIFPYISQSITINYINDIYLAKTYDYGTTGSDYMLYGNVHKVTTSFGSDGSKEVEYSYTNAGAWCPGKPYTVKETSSRTTPPSSFEKTTTYSYTNGAISGIIVSPGTTTSLSLNSFGLPDVITVSGTGSTTRTINREYDSKYRFVISEKNSLNHKTVTKYDARFGVPVLSKDISNLVTTYTYDGFGRLKTTMTPQGNISTNTIAFESGTGMNNSSLYSISTTMTGVPNLKKYYDIFGRVVKEETQGYDGSANKVDYTYTAKGQLYTKSLPYETTSAGNITYTYSDPVGRVTYVSHPSGSSISYSYTPGSVVITNSSTGEVTTKTIDAFGLTTQSSGDPSGLIKYEYDSRGLLTKAESPGSIITMGYDDFGYRNSLIDPNAGNISYTNSAFGEMLTQVDAKGTFTMHYDEIGRLISKVHSTGVASNYTYYSDGFGIGKNEKIEGSDNVSYAYKYDRYGNTVELTENIQGKPFVSKYNYDNFGRTVKITYPTGFAVLNEFDPSTGYLKKVKKSDNTVIWEGSTSNQYLQPTKYYTAAGNLETKKSYDNFGNISGINTATGTVQDLTYNIIATTGLMDSRNDIIQGIDETFDYNDEMKRLKESHINSVLSQSVDYDALGNITFKSDVGDIEYDGIPYAVTAVKNGSYLPMKKQEMYCTVFQKVDYIKEFTDEAETNYNYAKFTYGPDDQRRIMKQYYNTDLQRSKYYTTNFEREEYTDGARELHYISASDGLCAIYVKSNRNSITSDTLYFIYKDHLGSITTITDESGNILQQLRYDPWGKRTVLSGMSSPIFDRGFTGHEHLDIFALINMNSRVYDPVLGRFLSPDKYTQLPDYTQSYNKYTYCLNNPLKYTDPSGNFLWTIISGVVDALVTAFGRGGLDFSSGSGDARNNAWSNYDPSAEWSMTNKAWKIDQGLLQSDPNKSTGERVDELVSRFSYQILQTAVGYIVAGIHNLLGGVKSVDSYGGATVIEGYSDNWGALTLGNYIIGSDNGLNNGIKADPNNDLFQHEYGHYLQSQNVGLFYLFVYGAPSLIKSMSTPRNSNAEKHFYTEQNANRSAYNYFNYHINNYNGWVFGESGNPIDKPDADTNFWDWGWYWSW